MTIGMKKLSSKTLKKVYNRHYQLLGCFNYERQMSTGYADDDAGDPRAVRG